MRCSWGVGEKDDEGSLYKGQEMGGLGITVAVKERL